MAKILKTSTGKIIKTSTGKIVTGEAQSGISVPAMSMLVLYDFTNGWPYALGKMNFAVWKSDTLACSLNRPTNCVDANVPTIPLGEGESKIGYQIIDLSSLSSASGSKLMTRFGQLHNISVNNQYRVSSLGQTKRSYSYIYNDGPKVFSDEDIAAIKAGTGKNDSNYIAFNPGSGYYYYEFATNMQFEGYDTTLGSNTIIVLYISAYSED